MEARNYTVEQLLEATMVSSANSAAIALAEKIAGSEKDFVDKMRAKLLEWGIQDATIVNTTGLNNETLGDNIYPGSKKDDENKLSAYDVAIVARNLIRDYPQVLEITKNQLLPLQDLKSTQPTICWRECLPIVVVLMD